MGGDGSDSTRAHPSATRGAGWLLLIVALLGVAIDLYWMRDDALTDARRNIANLALILGEQTGRSVQAIDLGLRDLEYTISDLQAGTSKEFQEALNGQAFRQVLQDKRALISQADFVSVVNDQGQLVNTSRVDGRIGLDLSDRDYFRVLSKQGDSQLFISAPVQDKSLGEWTLFLARRISAKNGTFLGVVLAGVRLRYFEDIYRSIDLPHAESFLLLRRDGTVLVRHPDLVRRAGQIMPKESPWHDLSSKGGGFYTSPGYFDGITRIVAVRPLSEFPLVVNASVSEDAVLSTWRRQALLLGGGSVVIFGYAAFLMRLSRKQFARLKQSRESVLQQNADLLRLSGELERNRLGITKKTVELQTILNTMDQGLLMVDHRGVVVHCNERARELLDIPATFIETAPRFTEVLRYQWETNQSGRDEESYEQFVRKRTVIDVSHIQELKRPDGRVLEVRGVPLPDGGFVRTYTDITARKSAESHVRYLAHHDDLTRLTNRVAFREHLSEALTMARSSGRGTAILYLDLDHFKAVNDTFGHEGGDAVLADAAERMRASVRMIDTVARLGGDEFAIILPFLDDPTTAESLAQRLIASIGSPYVLKDQSCTVGVSIGIALFPLDANSADDLLAQADSALYAAKRSGRSTYRFVERVAQLGSRTAQ